jgi:hypothetical protein
MDAVIPTAQNSTEQDVTNEQRHTKANKSGAEKERS